MSNFAHIMNIIITQGDAKFVAYQLQQWDSYIQLVGSLHITYFAFHFMANATAFVFYSQRQIPYLRGFFVFANSIAGVLSAGIFGYYLYANSKINKFTDAYHGLFAEDLLRPLPQWLWGGVAATLTVVIFLMVIGWWYAPEKLWPENKKELHEHIDDIVDLVREVIKIFKKIEVYLREK